MLPSEKKLNFENFLEIDNKSDSLMEFIDGDIYLQASPSTMHQRISRRISTIFDIYVNDKECGLFVASYDIILSSENEMSKSKIIPDLSVICDKKGLNEKNYYDEPITFYRDDIAKSNLFNNLNVNLKEIFGD